MNNVAKASFRSTQALNAKLSIGEAATVLEDKISGLSQVVSLALILRTTSSSSVMYSQSEMVSQECSVFPRSRQERWLSFLQA